MSLSLPITPLPNSFFSSTEILPGFAENGFPSLRASIDRFSHQATMLLRAPPWVTTNKVLPPHALSNLAMHCETRA